MNGITSYNNSFIKMSMKKIKSNPDKEYLESLYYYILSDTSYSGAYTYLGVIVKFINDCSINDIRNIKLDDYTKYMARIKNFSSSHKIVTYSALKKFSLFLKVNNYNEDYMQFIKRPKFKESQKTKDRRENGFMTKMETKDFMSSIKNSDKKDCWKYRDIAIANVFLNTGIRESALIKLDVKDIDFLNKKITVLEKGDNGRCIYLSDSTIDSIKAWLNYRNDLLDGKDEDALFLSNHKKRMCRKTIYNIIKEYGEVVNGKNITPHKLRDTYGTNLYAETGDLYFVQECMGHSNPKTTEIYIRGQKEINAKRAASIMSSFVE